MIASIVLASFLCTVDANNVDSCSRTYEATWQGASEYHKDKETCLTLKNAMFPDDVVIDKDDKNKFTFAGCYRVLPGQWVGGVPDVVYMQNVEDADDSMIDAVESVK